VVKLLNKSIFPKTQPNRTEPFFTSPSPLSTEVCEGEGLSLHANTNGVISRISFSNGIYCLACAWKIELSISPIAALSPALDVYSFQKNILGAKN